MNLGKKTLVFYHFQNQGESELNMTTVSGDNSKEVLIRDVIAVLPIDLSQGLFHFRFKTQFMENEQKSDGWIDISNLTAKVPIINQAVHVKILTLLHDKYNKLFSLDRLAKAGVNFRHATADIKELKQVKKQMVKEVQQKVKEVKEVKGVQEVKQMVSPKSNRQKPYTPAQVVEPVASGSVDYISIKPAKYTPSTPQQNLVVMQEAYKEEEEAKRLEGLAKAELDEKINKWGYTDGKKINNTPTLLATLHQIWPDWKAVSLADLLQPEQVVAQFKKAVIKVHPDKNREAHYLRKYLAKRVFELLNQSRRM